MYSYVNLVILHKNAEWKNQDNFQNVHKNTLAYGGYFFFSKMIWYAHKQKAEFPSDLNWTFILFRFNFWNKQDAELQFKFKASEFKLNVFNEKSNVGLKPWRNGWMGLDSSNRNFAQP